MTPGACSGQRPNERGPEDILALRTGLTVADASNLFDASFARPELIEGGCNMHARRYFVKALGERAAIAYTILGSSRLAGVDPRENSRMSCRA
jgi:hypothetical protein